MGSGVQDFRYEQVLIEENTRFGEPGFFMNLHSRLVGPYIGQLGTEEQKDRLLPGFVSGERILAVAMTEPGAGSDVAGMKCRAEDQGDHWLLNGSKTYISKTDSLRTSWSSRRGRCRTNVTELACSWSNAAWKASNADATCEKIGLHGQDTSELFFNDVKVPKSNVLGDPRKGFHFLTHFLAEERLIGAVQYMAGAQGAWDLTLEWVQQRRMFGKPLGAFQNTRFKLAELRAQLDCTQTFVDTLVMEHSRGDSARISPPKPSCWRASWNSVLPMNACSCSAARGTWRSSVSRVASPMRASRAFTPAPRRS